MKKKYKKIVYRAIIAVLVFVMLFSGYQIFKILYADSKGSSTYSELTDYVETSQTDDSSVSETVYPTVDFSSLSAINSDIVGWLYIENTPINYPIVQGSDNDYYLRRLFDKTYNRNGSIFMDYRNSAVFSDRNTVIYGHHMKTQMMFSTLAEYKNQEYYNAHPQALLVTPDKNYTVDIFAGYVANTDDSAWQLSFDSDEAFNEWVTSVCARSCFTSNVQLTPQDKIVTFSTCSYEFENARFVLFGVLR